MKRGLEEDEGYACGVPMARKKALCMRRKPPARGAPRARIAPCVIRKKPRICIRGSDGANDAYRVEKEAPDVHPGLRWHPEMRLRESGGSARARGFGGGALLRGVCCIEGGGALEGLEPV
jgi:hypothetical protein